MKRIRHRFSIFALLAVLILALSAGVFSACSNNNMNGNGNSIGEIVSTTRMDLPTDSSLPTQHSAIENIAYMATVLDNQPLYHAYAHNSSKSMGYEQVTQTWKDYKSAAVSGVGKSIMISTDLSYSSLVKMSAQKLMINSEEAYVRSGEKPSKKSVPTDIAWSEENPTYYDKESYVLKYGEFSTELTVFKITAETIKSSEPVKDNGDGTYSLSVSLTEDAGCWYKYAMRTNGSLKEFPEFEKIDLTFIFDGNWQVLKTVCVETEKITPKALGGVPSTSTAKTTTTYSYSESDLDAGHLAYYDSYYKNHLGNTNNSTEEGEKAPELLDVLGGGFGGVVNAEGNGQQFKLDLSIGKTKYEGKLFLKLGDMGDILGSLQVRLALEKAGSGKQDLYVEFQNGRLNAYYSNDFALTAEFAAITQSLGGFSDFIAKFAEPDESEDVAVNSESSGGLDINSLLSSLKMTQRKTSVRIEIDTDDLLGLGIGVKLQINFSRSTDKEGNDTYEFRNLLLGELSVSGKPLDISATIVGDKSEVIARNPSETPANLTDYISGLLDMLGSETLAVNLSVNGENSSVSYLDGVTLNVDANVYLSNIIKVGADIAGEYNGLSLKLHAYYEIDIHGGNYGNIYLNVTEFCGEKLDIKLSCDIKDAVKEVEDIISAVNGGASAQSDEASTESAGIAKILNVVLNLNFARLITDLKGNSSEISLKLDIDEVLGALGLDLGEISLGKADLALLYHGNSTAISANVAALGLNVDIEGSDKKVSKPAGEYLDVNDVLKLVTKAALEVTDIISAEAIGFDLDAALTVDGVKLSVKGTGEVSWNDGVKVAVDAVASISENSKKSDVAVKFYYDTLSGVIKLYINGLGFAFTPEEANEYARIFSDLSKSEKSGNATAAEAASANGFAADDIVTILQNEDVQSLISSVISALSNLSVTLDKADTANVNSLVIENITNGIKNLSLTLSTENKLSLAFNINNNNGTEILSGNVSVEAGSGSILGKISKLTPEYAATKDSLLKTVYTYLFAVIEDLSVGEVLGNRTFNVDLSLNGAMSQIPALKDNNIVVDATLSYAEGAKKLVSVAFNASFDISIEGATHNAGAVGTVLYTDEYLYLHVTQITFDALEFNLSLKGKAEKDDIYSAVEFVLGLISKNASELDVAPSDGAVAITNVLTRILALDFSKAFDFYKEDGKNVFALATDYVLETLGVDLGYAIGSVKVSVEPESHEVTATVKNTGVDPWAELNTYTTSGNAFEGFDPSAYVDLAEIVKIALSAKDEVESIINSNYVVFDVKLDDTNIQLVGNGEVTWDKQVNAAVNATLTINNKQYDAYFLYEDGSITFVLKNENFEEKPIVLSFPAEDAEKVGEDVAKIANFASEGKVPASAGSEVGELITAISNSEAVASVINLICKALNTFTVTEDGNIKLTNSALSVTFESTSGLDISIASSALNGKITAKAGDGKTIENIAAAVENYDETDISSLPILTKDILTFLEDTYTSISFKEVLGDSSYEITVEINGDNSAIFALKGISGTADIFVTQPESGKVIELVIDLEINKAPVKLSAILTNEKIYFTLERIASVALNNLKVSASISDLNGAIVSIVDLLSNANIAGLLDNFKGETTETQDEELQAFAVVMSEPDTSRGVTSVIKTLLSLDIDELFSYEKPEDGKITVMLDIDSIVSVFTNSVQVGTLNATVEGCEVHAGLAVDNKEWLSLDANKTTAKTYNINEEQYLDISFISSLVSDLKNTLTDDDGDIYTMYTFTGTIKIPIKFGSLGADIEISQASLTVGFKGGDFYVSVIGQLNNTAATTAGVISITYSGGYLTLGRDGTFKIMTFEYFLDTLTDTNKSGLKWLLGTSNFAWGIVFTFVKLDISSGLTTPQEYYYYDTTDANKSSSMDIASLINGIFVKLSDTDPYEAGNDKNALKDKFGNGKDCYAFSLNLSSLLGNTLKYLYVGLTRDADENGNNRISGFKVFTNVANYVTVELDLSTKYLEGFTTDNDYTDTLGEVCAPNYFEQVKDAVDFNKYANETVKDHKKPIFGCVTLNKVDGKYKAEDGDYDPSNLRSEVTLTIIDPDIDEAVDEITLRYESTVYLFNSISPKTVVKDGVTYVYKYVSDKNSEDYISSIQLNDDNTVIYRVAVATENKVNIETDIKDESVRSRLKTSVYLLKGEKLDEYSVSGYTFLGWYNEEGKKITEYNGEVTIYGKYVRSEVAVNGVIYAYDNGADKQCYYVKSFTSEIREYYYQFNQNGEKWLTLESSIDGIAVSYIGASAFSLEAAGEEQKSADSLVNVLVPESITSVYEMAFKDNKELKNVVFLADEISFAGDYKQSKSVFYGCWKSEYLNNKINVNITVYFKALKNGTSSSWNYCKKDDDHRVNCSTNWIYAQFTYDVINSEEKITDNDIKLNGFYDKAYDKEELKEIIRVALDTYLFEKYNYSDAYEIMLDCGLNTNGNSIVVKLRKKESTKSPLNVTMNINGVKTIQQVFYNAPVEYLNKFMTSDEIELLYGWYAESTFDNLVNNIYSDIELFARMREKYSIGYSMSRDSQRDKTAIVYCYDEKQNKETVESYKKPIIGGKGSVTHTDTIDVYEGETVKFSYSTDPVGNDAPNNNKNDDNKVFNFIIIITDIHGNDRSYYFHAQLSNYWNMSVNVTLAGSGVQTVSGAYSATNFVEITEILMGPDTCTSLKLTLDWGNS